VKTRWFFIYCALLLLPFAKGALGDGAYQRTKDGQTLIWNNYPKPNDAAKWSGERDADGYATGHGTLTWYTVKRGIVTGSILPSTNYIPTGRYSGNMVRGKFDGTAVTVSANGKTYHATFANGRKTSAWIAGPGPIPDQKRNEPVQQESVAEETATAPAPVTDQPRPVPAHPDTIVETPAQGPAATAERPADRHDSEAPSLASNEQINQHVPEPGLAETSSATKDSLQSLTSPPSTLRVNLADASPIPMIASSLPPRTRLTSAEVIQLAAEQARAQGYDLNQYQHPQVRYTAADDTWLVFYQPKQVESIGPVGKEFSVTVEDKTKKASIAAGH
jgi:hypothetical protein